MEQKEEKQLIKVVKGFTKGLLSNDATTDMCFAVCAPLSAYLELCGWRNELTEGEIEINGEIFHHFWITLSNGKIVDPTADQFGLINLYAKPQPESYKRIP